ncbi:MAG: nuclear transport factor 2 family protein [Acidimicrobiia bacterium]
MGDHDRSDHRDVHRVLVAYCDCIDERDIDRLARDVYTPDAVDDHGWGPWTGIDAILEGLRPVVVRFAGTAHLMSNVDIEVDGDEARSRAGVTAWHWNAGNLKGVADFVAVGRYTDSLVRTEQGWRLRHREYRPIGPTIKAAGELAPMPS